MTRRLPTTTARTTEDDGVAGRSRGCFSSAFLIAVILGFLLRRRLGRLEPAAPARSALRRSVPWRRPSPTCTPKTLENAKRQFVELYGSALVMNTYLKIALLLVSLVALGAARPELPHRRRSTPT